MDNQVYDESQSPERMHNVLLQLSGIVRTRLRRFMNRQEFVGMRPTEIIGILLDREEVHPDNTHSYALRRRPPRSPLNESRSSVLIPQQSLGLQQEITVYTFDHNSDVPAATKNVVIYQNPEDHGINIGHVYDGGFVEEGELLEAQEILLDNYAEDGGRTANDYRNTIGQRMDYFSSNDRNSDIEIIDSNERRRVAEQTAKKRNSRPKFPQEKLNIAGQKQWTAALRRHWYGLIVRYQTDGLLHCRICNSCMDVVGRGVGLRAGNAFDHACKHLGKPLFVCRICSQTAISAVEIRDHVRVAHQADTRTFVDFVDIYSNHLEQMVAYCFQKPAAAQIISMPKTPDANAEKNKGKRKRKKRGALCPGYNLLAKMDASTNSKTTVRQYCYQMIIKWQRNKTLYCRECDQWLRVAAKNNWLRSETAMQHACSHYGKPLYKCRLCPQSTATSRQMRQHIQTMHKRGIRGQYDDLTETLQTELKQIVACCFDWSEAEGGPPASGGRYLRPKVRSGLENNADRREILQQCRNLIQTYVVDGRMQCQVCETTFVATTANGYPLAETVYNHSLKHLDPPPYACGLCSKRTYTSGNMRTHIFSKHKNTPLTEFIDYTGQLHVTVSAMLNRCFMTNGIVEPQLLNEGMDEDSVSESDQDQSVMDETCYAEQSAAESTIGHLVDAVADGLPGGMTR